MVVGAIITGDIVGSTQLSKAESKKLMKEFDALLSAYTYEFYRGDSFQVYVKSAGDALGMILQMRAIAMKIRGADSLPVSDVKSSIGIGQIKSPVRLLRTATSEAFVLSGRGFDSMKAPQRLLIAASEKNKIANIGFAITGDYIDSIFRRMTTKQAGVVHELLQNRTQTETAKRLKKSQATVNKHAQSAGWPELEKLLANYKLLVNAVIL